MLREIVTNRKMIGTTLVYWLVVLLVAAFVQVESWRLDKLGLDENVIRLSGIAVHIGRAFVAIPRVEEGQPITLAELPWPEHLLYTPFNTKPFPSFDSQISGDCSKLQSAVALDKDSKGRLYVLDQGIAEVCPPKIIVYDITSSQELMQRDLRGVPTENMTSLVVDVNPENSAIRVIIGDAGNNSLLVYSFNEHTWWRLTVTMSDQQQHIVDNFIWPDDEPRKLTLNRLAIDKGSSTLYAASSNADDVYSVDLEELRKMEEPLPIFSNYYDYNGTEIAVKYVGSELGPSSAMFVDTQGNFYYMYSRDYVVLKWNPKYPFTAEYTDVVLQDDDLLPDVVQIFSGLFYQVFALNSRKNGRNLYTYASSQIIQEWRNAGIVEDTSSSSYASPALLVPKKTGESKAVFNYRALNR